MNDQPSTSRLSGVPQTMILTLKGRADEQKRGDRLFWDPLALDWSQSLPWDDKLEAVYNRNMQTFLAIRASYYDGVASRHIANNSQPILVELGAGLSTRYHRIGSDVYRWFDLDLPVGIDVRRQLDTETEQHQLISSSVLDFSWMDRIPKVPPENILFLAEGLLMYLKVSDVQQLINRMRSRFPGSTLLMDVLGNSLKYGTGSKKLSKMDVYFQWYAKDRQELEAMGLSVTNVLSPLRIHPERWSFPIKLLALIPAVRNSYLMVETKLEPLSKG